MKKILIFICMAGMIFGLCACGDNATTTPTTAPAQTITIVDNQEDDYCRILPDEYGMVMFEVKYLDGTRSSAAVDPINYGVYETKDFIIIKDREPRQDEEGRMYYATGIFRKEFITFIRIYDDASKSIEETNANENE